MVRVAERGIPKVVDGVGLAEEDGSGASRFMVVEWPRRSEVAANEAALTVEQKKVESLS